MLLMASNAYLGEVNLKGAGRDIVCLSMPLKVHELVSTVDMMCQSMERRRRRPAAQSQGAETGGDGPDQRGEMPG